MFWTLTDPHLSEQAESGLRFLGLIVFENKLKEGTAPAIQLLHDARIAVRMATGDNHRTAISVARECGFISRSVHVFFPRFIVGDAQPRESKLDWTSVDDEALRLDPYSLKPLPPPAHHTDSDNLQYSDYTLAMTGDVFKWMVNNSPLETLHRVLLSDSIATVL